MLGAPASLITAATWRNDHLYVLLRLDKSQAGVNVIPLHLGFRSRKAAHLNELIFLPPKLKAGHWLLSMRVPKNHVREIAIGGIEPYSRRLWVKDLGRAAQRPSRDAAR
jgi:hypothetical protein